MLSVPLGTAKSTISLPFKTNFFARQSGLADGDAKSIPHHADKSLILTSDKPLHPTNASSPILVTLGGIVTDAKRLQL